MGKVKVRPSTCVYCERLQIETLIRSYKQLIANDLFPLIAQKLAYSESCARGC